jgi:hypothetical protein
VRAIAEAPEPEPLIQLAQQRERMDGLIGDFQRRQRFEPSPPIREVGQGSPAIRALSPLRLDVNATPAQAFGPQARLGTQ